MGQDVKSLFPFDAELEDDTIANYNEFLLVCRKNGDSISLKLFEVIIDEEQIHYNYFDNVKGHIEKLGPVYLAQIAETRLPLVSKHRTLPPLKVVNNTLGKGKGNA